MRTGEGRGKAPMRGWMVDRHLRKGPLTAGQKDAVKLILSSKDRASGRAGVCRDRQDDDAQTHPGARREEGLADGGARAVGLRGADTGGRIGYRERDPAAVPRP